MKSNKIFFKLLTKSLLITSSVPCFNCCVSAMESVENNQDKGMLEYLKSKLREFLLGKMATSILGGRRLNVTIVVDEQFMLEFIDYLEKVPENEKEDIDEYTGANTKDECHKAFAAKFLQEHRTPLRLLKKLVENIGYQTTELCCIIL